MDRTCEAEGCERKSAMPEPYPADCAKHYFARVDEARRAAADRMFRHGVHLYLVHLAP